MINRLLLEMHNNTLIVTMKGEIDHANANEYKQLIVEKLELENCRSLILDFSEVSFIDSSGIGLILGRYNQMRSINGILAIAGASNQLMKLLQISGVNSIIRCYRSAIEAFKEVGKYESYRAKVQCPTPK